MASNKPIVVDKDGVVIVGHTRLKAAMKLGLEQVPVHVADNLSEAEVKAYRIADNQTATLATWDLEKLPGALEELRALDVDLSLLGFDEDQLAKLLDPGVKEGLCDPDDVPEPPDAAITQPGDLWILGDHRLICGDSSSASDVDRLLEGQPIHLVNSDPPYNVKVEPRSNNAIAAGLSSFGEHGLTHHQSFDLHRAQKRTASRYHEMDVATGAQSGKPTHRKLHPKDRPLSEQRYMCIRGAKLGMIMPLCEANGSRVNQSYMNIGAGGAAGPLRRHARSAVGRSRWSDDHVRPRTLRLWPGPERANLHRTDVRIVDRSRVRLRHGRRRRAQ